MERWGKWRRERCEKKKRSVDIGNGKRWADRPNRRESLTTREREHPSIAEPFVHVLKDDPGCAKCPKFAIDLASETVLSSHGAEGKP